MKFARTKDKGYLVFACVADSYITDTWGYFCGRKKTCKACGVRAFGYCGGYVEGTEVKIKSGTFLLLEE